MSDVVCAQIEQEKKNLQHNKKCAHTACSSCSFTVAAFCRVLLRSVQSKLEARQRKLISQVQKPRSLTFSISFIPTRAAADGLSGGAADAAVVRLRVVGDGSGCRHQRAQCRGALDHSRRSAAHRQPCRCARLRFLRHTAS